MIDANCGNCHLFTPDEPGGFTGRCRYFPPHLVVVEGKQIALRAPVTRDEGCQTGWRPLATRPVPLMLNGQPYSGDDGQLINDLRERGVLR